MIPMTNFTVAFGELIGNEGGFKRQASDRMDWTSGKVGVGLLVGTKYGISAGTYPTVDIVNLSLEGAQRIYKKDWWDSFQGDQLPYELAFQVFDAEINHGHKMGVKFLQRALKLTDDGYIGPLTLNAVKSAPESMVILRFLAIRLAYFTQCKTWDIDGRGWANRVSMNMLKATEPNEGTV